MHRLHNRVFPYRDITCCTGRLVRVCASESPSVIFRVVLYHVDACTLYMYIYICIRCAAFHCVACRFSDVACRMSHVGMNAFCLSYLRTVLLKYCRTGGLSDYDVLSTVYLTLYLKHVSELALRPLRCARQPMTGRRDTRFLAGMLDFSVCIYYLASAFTI